VGHRRDVADRGDGAGVRQAGDRPPVITAAPIRSKLCAPVTTVWPLRVTAAGVCTAPVESRPVIWPLTAVSEADDDTQSMKPAGVMS
jgi:hypothetical protein